MKIYLLLSQLLFICLCTEVIATGDICKSTYCACCKSGECIVAGEHICEGCREGFTTDTCREQCPDNCFNCSQTFFSHDRTCYACKPGYYNGRREDNMEQPLQNDCSLRCKPNCKICDSYNNCYQCNISHFMSSNKTCEQCKQNCEICSSATDCIKCKDGHFKGDVEGCKSCIQNCKTCSSYVDCQECIHGYYLDKNECQQCQEGCISCNDTRICNKCEKKFHLFDTSCFYFPEVSCEDNKNSIVCKEDCLNRCLNRVCNDSDGSCTAGCLSGYWGGNTCNQTCVTFCKDTVCKFSDGKCNALFSSHARTFVLVIGLVNGGAVVIIIAVMCTCYFKRTYLLRRFKWFNTVDECLFLCCRRFDKGKHNNNEMKVVAKPLHSSSEQTTDVNNFNKNETESLLPAGELRNEKDDTQFNIPNERFQSADEPQTAKICFINVASNKKSSKYIVSHGSKIALNNESFWKKIWESQCEIVVILSTSHESQEFTNNLTYGTDQYATTVRFAVGRAWTNYTMIPATMEQEHVDFIFRILAYGRVH